MARSLRALPYRVASPLMDAYRRVRRPTVRGVRCVLVRGDEALLVRHTYGDRSWAWPGGGLRRREEPASGARREMEEELGLDVPDWRPLGPLEFEGREHARHVVWCFVGHVPDGGEVAPRAAEIAEVRWVPLADLPDGLLDGTTQIARRARAALDAGPA